MVLIKSWREESTGVEVVDFEGVGSSNLSEDLLLEDFFLCRIFRVPAQIEQSDSFHVITNLSFPFFSLMHLRHAW